ncbi:MAG: hypothetical protein ACYDH1_15930 [Anaerolineaceae bacterium]
MSKIKFFIEDYLFTITIPSPMPKISENITNEEIIKLFDVKIYKEKNDSFIKKQG